MFAALVDLISGREIRDNLATTLMRAATGLSLAAVCGIALMDMLLGKKRAGERKSWLETKGDLASLEA